MGGFEAWRDDQLPAHRAYSEIIEQRLRGASAVVVLWSKEAAQSQWVRAEADFARTERKLVQAQLDDTLPPMPFNQIQCADLRGWRGNPKHPGWTKLLESVAAVAAGEPAASPPTAEIRSRRSYRKLLLAGLALALLAVLAVVAFRLLAPASGGATTLAVLPFKNAAAADESLAFGISEDTRQALSRNPQLRVIGRQSAEALAQQGLEPREYRSKLGIAYLLDGTVRRAGQRVRVSVSLVRTKDGVEMWSDAFDRRLDDMFALQSEIAREIEGRIRGRLASGGGVKPENIATSGAVYLLFNDARATVLQR